MERNFTLVPNADNSRYFLKRHGEEGSMEFISLHAALAYARICPESAESKVIMLDFYGNETMRFPARLPDRKTQPA